MKKFISILLAAVLVLCSSGIACAAAWVCPSCGCRTNTMNFCESCGKPRPDDSWTCSCGQSGNTGAYCGKCGAQKPAEPVPPLEIRAEEGRYISLGSWEQDKSVYNGTEAMEWLVLEVRNGRALLLSRYLLDSRAYYIPGGETDWQASSLRTWLNGPFISGAFTEEERSRILAVNVGAQDNSSYGTDAGSSTRDYIWLMSLEEAKNYSDVWQGRLSGYLAYSGGELRWWLRTPGLSRYNASLVMHDGRIDPYGANVRGSLGVRPAMWIAIG